MDQDAPQTLSGGRRAATTRRRAGHGHRHALHRGPGPGQPATAEILDLTDPRSRDASLAGAKAANLARAAGTGLPVVPGFVMSTGGPVDRYELLKKWNRLSHGGTRPVVVRSSSTVEDIGTSSMAGQFTSVLGVRDWATFQKAVADVRRSARRAHGGEHPPAPMAILVQLELAPVVAGVLFGVDPITGDRSHLMVEVVQGSPSALVGGTVTADRYVTTRHGRVLERPPGGKGKPPGRPPFRKLAKLARRVAKVFGSPQDVEWGVDDSGTLWLLQSRPVTATGDRQKAAGPTLGPGPVSETFPDVLRPLEEELWVAPLAEGIRGALRITGAASRRRLRRSSVAVTVKGRVALDLDLAGGSPRKRSALGALSPRRPARRLVAAWRVGQLRAVLPGQAARSIAGVDRWLASIPRLSSLDDRELMEILRSARIQLAKIHAREVLAGILLSESDAGTAASVALQEVARGHAGGLDDPAIVNRDPIVLSLTPPRIGTPRPLPRVVSLDREEGEVPLLGWREALRLRARWLQELTARSAYELGRRLKQRHLLAASDHVALLSLAELEGALSGAPVTAGLLRRVPAASPPLPPAFRVTPAGDVVVPSTGSPATGGRPAGGGRGAGRVVHVPEPGTKGVLVVDNLSPDLAAVLPTLDGLVSETGSTLSHLAILAREFGVPTVVGVPGARRRFAEGTTVVVDGGTGEVSVIDEPQARAA